MWRDLKCPVCSNTIDRQSVGYTRAFVCPHCGTPLGLHSRLRTLLIKVGVVAVGSFELAGRVVRGQSGWLWLVGAATLVAVADAVLFEAPVLEVRDHPGVIPR
jgi:hypothetical protein